MARRARGDARETQVVDRGQAEGAVDRDLSGGSHRSVDEEAPDSRARLAAPDGDVGRRHAHRRPQVLLHRRGRLDEPAVPVLPPREQVRGDLDRHRVDRGEGMPRFPPGGRTRFRSWVAPEGANAGARHRQADGQERDRGEPGSESDGEEERPRDEERARLRHELPTHPRGDAPVIAGDAGHRDPGGDGQEERRDLGRQAIAHREEQVAPGRSPGGHSLQDPGRHPPQRVHQCDGDPGHRVSLHELEGAIHGAVELALALELAAAAPGLGGVDGPRAQLCVDGHLLAGKGVEGEAGRHLRHPLGAPGDDEELDERQDGVDHRTRHPAALHDDPPERLDHPAGLPTGQDQPGGGHRHGEAEERGEEQDRREGREAEGVGGEQGGEEHGSRDAQAGRDQRVHDRWPDRHEEEADEHDDGEPRGELRDPPDPGSSRVHSCPPESSPWT